MIKILSAALRLSAAMPPDAASAQDNAVKVLSRMMVGSGLPVAAPGRGLSLCWVTFEPKASIPGEVHPGRQVVYTVSGRLSLQGTGCVAVFRRAQRRDPAKRPFPRIAPYCFANAAGSPAGCMPGRRPHTPRSASRPPRPPAPVECSSRTIRAPAYLMCQDAQAFRLLRGCTRTVVGSHR